MLFHNCALRDNGVFSDIREKTDYSSHADICAVAYIIPVDHCAVTDRDARFPMWHPSVFASGPPM